MAGKAFNFKLGGETSFLGGSSFCLGGAVFQRGRYWGVSLHREDRNRNGGGVAVNVRKSLKHNRRTDIPDKSLEFIFIEIEPIKARPFLIFAWYRPPSARIESFKKLEGNLEFFDRENKEMIILGDTNCDFSSKVADEYSSSLNNTAHLAEIYDLFGLTQMIGEPTRVTLNSSTLIDHIATNKPETWLHLAS